MPKVVAENVRDSVFAPEAGLTRYQISELYWKSLKLPRRVNATPLYVRADTTDEE